MTNTSGLTPLEYNVLLEPDEIATTTKGGLHLAPITTEHDKHRSQRGTIVALSPFAFNDDIYPADMPKPQPGQRVAIALHAGAFVTGEDGKEYRMVKDKDITALIG
ncbi:hypothetical protein [Loktanella sp. R86503]|jgi:co-chaperonin GroES (HSP10)|uniref:hypothetical protein n=1 Tax=Loktanella sp. R86503 TaxID=3093847 RepID=UPI0036D7A1E2